jgi:hypothetical protein
MVTPSSLSVKPNVKAVVMPDYDFEGQFRWDLPLMAAYTGNSIQTFDAHGKPNDSRSDNND